MPRRVVGAEVHAQHDRDVLALRGRGDEDLLRPCRQVLGGAVAIGEEARGLDHDVDAEVAPWQCTRVTLGEHLQLLAVDKDAAVGRLDFARVAPEDRVVVEQLGECLGVGQVVRGDPFDVGVSGLSGAEDVAPDAAEAVDSNAYWHAQDPTYEPPLTTSTR